jgi:type VI secretion system protein ImpJ
MHLAPHHFQLQNRYFEDLIDFGARALNYCAVGVSGVEWNEEALANGTLILAHARGFFPDGLAFLIPESDPPPAPRSIRGVLSPVAHAETIHLAIPLLQEGGVNCADERVRFSPAENLVFDETTGLDGHPIACGRKNLRLLLEAELNQGMISLPVGRVVRDGAGGLVFDSDFIPPSINIAASPRLMLMIHRLLAQLEEKAASLMAERSPASIGGFTQREVASFWYLHCVNSGLTELRHLSQAKHVHPEELYQALLRLAGFLCTFVLESDLIDRRLYHSPSELPFYSHFQPEACFLQVEGHIRAALDTMLPLPAVKIPLRPTGAYMREADIIDDRCYGRARWILGLRARMPQSALISEVPNLVKFCALQFVDELVRRALPGMELIHIPIPPAEVKPKLEMQYFGISRTGPCWEYISKTKQVGVYIPGEFSEAEVELTIITES